MAISVVCAGCKKRFKVSDQFAGKIGPCPHCKTPIKIPEKEPEVKVHVPEEFESGGRGRSGQLIIKPIARREVRWDPVMVAAIGGSVLVTAAVAYFGGSLFRESMLGRLVGMMLVSPPLVVAGYTLLYDDELEPYAGRPLYVRAGLCAAVYILLWALFGYVVGPMLSGELWNWFFIAPPFLLMGTLAGYATLDLDFSSAFLQYGFYVLVTVVLRWLADMTWTWGIATPI
jgi:hypothetical protein